jgi:formylglycine-generating enzyme required for sulfatase activity
MHGNLWELCLDEWGDTYYNTFDTMIRGDMNSRDEYKIHVLRGGSWSSKADMCRSASRLKCLKGSRYPDIGFRVMCSL